jgi:hypothetical protein
MKDKYVMGLDGTPLTDRDGKKILMSVFDDRPVFDKDGKVLTKKTDDETQNE